MNDPVHLLLVEDDADLAGVLALFLKHQQIDVRRAADCETARHLLRQQTFDVVLLDVGLPDGDGWTLAAEMPRLAPGTPYLFVTARGRPDDIKRGLRAGADDYLVKPYDAEELVLRIEAILRRRSTPGQAVLSFGRLQLDPRTRTLTGPAGTCQLTERECALLAALARNAGAICTRTELLEEVWGRDDFFLGRSMDVYIGRLRKALALDDRVSIVTVRGVGFRLDPN